MKLLDENDDDYWKCYVSGAGYGDCDGGDGYGDGYGDGCDDGDGDGYGDGAGSSNGNGRSDSDLTAYKWTKP